MAVLAGTDYLPSIKGIGIKTAVKYMSQFSNIHEVIDYCRKSDKYKTLMPANYESDVLKAKLIFMLATCFNTVENKLEFLDPTYLK